MFYLVALFPLNTSFTLCHLALYWWAHWCKLFHLDKGSHLCWLVYNTLTHSSGIWEEKIDQASVFIRLACQSVCRAFSWLTVDTGELSTVNWVSSTQDPCLVSASAPDPCFLLNSSPDFPSQWTVTWELETEIDSSCKLFQVMTFHHSSQWTPSPILVFMIRLRAPKMLPPFWKNYENTNVFKLYIHPDSLQYHMTSTVTACHCFCCPP